MAWEVLDKFQENQQGANQINIDTGGVTIKCGLLTDSHTPAVATEELWSSIDSNEVATGSSYSAGGPTVSGQAITLDTGVVTFDVSDITIAQDATGFTDARYAYLYDSSSSRIICYADLASDRSIVTGPLGLQIDEDGVFTISKEV